AAGPGRDPRGGGIFGGAWSGSQLDRMRAANRAAGFSGGRVGGGVPVGPRKDEMEKARLAAGTSMWNASENARGLEAAARAKGETSENVATINGDAKRDAAAISAKGGVDRETIRQQGENKRMGIRERIANAGNAAEYARETLRGLNAQAVATIQKDASEAVARISADGRLDAERARAEVERFKATLAANTALSNAQRNALMTAYTAQLAASTQIAVADKELLADIIDAAGGKRKQAMKIWEDAREATGGGSIWEPPEAATAPASLWGWPTEEPGAPTEPKDAVAAGGEARPEAAPPEAPAMPPAGNAGGTPAAPEAPAPTAAEAEAEARRGNGLPEDKKSAWRALEGLPGLGREPLYHSRLEAGLADGQYTLAVASDGGLQVMPTLNFRGRRDRSMRQATFADVYKKDPNLANFLANHVYNGERGGKDNGFGYFMAPGGEDIAVEFEEG
ncbi:MAG: hypothetical protein IK066_10140, partial [Kiritimatiellae bacterium]|nr:hypothetical protein [Kiritimatiellia bacterium]